MAKDKAGVKTGYYHNHFAKPHGMTVLKENDDGTVNIGEPGETPEKDKLMVRNCPVSKTAKMGHFTPGKLPSSVEGAEKLAAVLAPTGEETAGGEGGAIE